MDEIDLARLDEVVRSNIDSLCRNFFPAGRKKGGEWKLADISGAAGDSLGIQLSGPNAGLAHDRATGQGWTFVQLLAENRGVTFPEAVELIERFLGISLRKAQRQNITRSAAPKPFGNSRWKECVKCMTPSKRAELCDYRGYSPDFVNWLVDHQLIGICKDKGGVERWAFPVHHNGEVVAIHWEIPGEDRKNWFYWPRLSELGLKLSPFILGDLSSATEVHIHEGQWDLLAQADVLAFDAESQGIAFVATLSSSNGALAAVVNKCEAKIYIWPQRDVADEKGKVASREWLSKVQSTLERSSYVCWIPDLEPKRNFDFNDWRRGRKLSPDDVTLIMRSAEAFDSRTEAPPRDFQVPDPHHTEPESKSGEEQQPPPWDQSLSEGSCTSLALVEMKIEPRPPVFDDWCLVGDLGFIFAARGLGKTWLSMHLAHGAATLNDVGPWKTHKQLKVLYLDGEMPPQDIQSRDRVLGKPTENLIYINHQILFERTGRIMNLANSELQAGILSYCQTSGIGLLCLDNLSTLTSGVDENKSIDWEIIQPWLLRVRRSLITVIFIHHAGRNNEMRGSSKREDPASWVIRLDNPKDIDERAGAHFISRFTKWRCQKQPKTYEWKYEPSLNGEVCVEVKEASVLGIFRSHIQNGLDTCTMIAEEMDITPGYVSKLATQGVKEGWMEIKNRKYVLT
jgi:hypothetical protein